MPLRLKPLLGATPIRARALALLFKTVQPAAWKKRSTTPLPSIAYTGLTPKVALHIPWDDCADWQAMGQYANDQGIGIGAINPNVFEDQCYKYGSFGNADETIRRKAIDTHLRCIEVARATRQSV